MLLVQDIAEWWCKGLASLKDYLRMREVKLSLEAKRESMDSGVGVDCDSLNDQVPT